jgi:hypothetical protein
MFSTDLASDDGFKFEVAIVLLEIGVGAFFHAILFTKSVNGLKFGVDFVIRFDILDE